MRANRSTILLSAFLCFLGPNLSARDLPSVDLSDKETKIEDYALIRDPDGALQRDAVVERLERGQFEIHRQSEFDNFGINSDVLWIAFNSVTKAIEGSDTFLEVSSNVQNVKVMIRRSLTHNIDIWSVEKSGALVPVDRRPFPVTGIIFNAVVPPLSKTLVIVRIEHYGPLQLRIHLSTGPKTFESQENQNIAMLAYLGALCALILFNILLFAYMRDRNFIWFVPHLLNLMLYVFAVSGIGFKLLWPGWSGFQETAYMVFTWGIVLSGLGFFKALFHSPKLRRRLSLLLNIHALVCIAYFPVLALLPQSGLLVGAGLLVVSMAALFVVGTASGMWRHQDSRTVLAAFCCLFVGCILARFITLLPFVEGYALVLLEHCDFVGIFLEVLLLSFTLSRRLQEIRQQKEDAEAKSRLKQSFIANVSHEMRTPLNAIIGFAESIQDMNDPALMRRFNARILDESERLLFQINQVLDLAKLEAEHMTFDSEPFDLVESLAYLESVFRPQAEAKGIELAVETGGAKSAWVRGDRYRLEQVVRNLLDNAIKFTETGRVAVTLAVAKPVDGLCAVSLGVVDTGIGIAPEKQGEIFGEFVQADATITKRFGGTGLGTSISRKLVQAMGGELTLRSELGSGSTFTVKLAMPAAGAAVGAAGTEDSVDGQAVSSGAPVPLLAVKDAGKRPRLLVVDDFETNRQVVCIHLANLPIDVDTASNGPEALDLVYRRPYDLVLLDIFMPGLSGFDVARIIRERWKPDELPILGLTASGEQEDLAGALGSGMNGVLIKPVKRQVLLTNIRAFLSV